jgi:hypothetical protein
MTGAALFSAAGFAARQLLDTVGAPIKNLFSCVNHLAHAVRHGCGLSPGGDVRLLRVIFSTGRQQ